ncbi:MAG: hypothetical protein AB7F64_08465 [Gammaproteobacteria bacterium]
MLTQPYVVNLSSIIQLGKIFPDGIQAFVTLCDESPGWFASYPGLFRMTNYAWVSFQCYRHTKTIDDYKKELMNTDQFINELLNIFYFLKDKTDGRQLLVNAWNATINWDAESTARVRKLFSQANNLPIYFISNTNPLNFQKIMEFLRVNISEIQWNENIQIPERQIDDPKPVEIAPNIFVCLSFHYGLFKTPGLIENVIDHLGTEITLISQFEDDLKTASILGVSPANIHTAPQFYENSRNDLTL